MRAFIDLIPAIFIYAILCWAFLPLFHKKGMRWLFALLLLYPAYYLGSKGEYIFAWIDYYFSTLFP